MTEQPTERALHVLAVMIAAVAIAGYFVGTRPLAGRTTPSVPELEASLDSEGLARAPSYAELGGDAPGSIQARQHAAFTAMLGNRPSPTTERPLPTEAERLAALEARAARRS